jgi:maleylpyruvate isomerase
LIEDRGMLKLHNFFRSSASTRLRAALNYKQLPFEYVSYVLRRGDTRQPEFLMMNPAGLVPVLEREDGVFMSQSLAIAEWLEETHPTPPLLPTDADGRARVRALAYMIACEVHPLNNLRVLKHLGEAFAADEDAQKAWFTHWVTLTFDALEKNLNDGNAGIYCHGDTPSLADICLYAQVWNNTRFQIDVGNWPIVARVFNALNQIPEFRDAAPKAQPDAD